MADKTEQEFQKTMENSPWHAEFVQRYGEKPDLREGGDYNYRLAVNNHNQTHTIRTHCIGLHHLKTATAIL